MRSLSLHARTWRMKTSIRLCIYAVYARLPDMVRLLMQRGADARKGVWPHRTATTALAIAQDRGFAEIAAILEDEEQLGGAPRDPKFAAREALWRAFEQGD